jgi:hypothetical protein
VASNEAFNSAIALKNGLFEVANSGMAEKRGFEQLRGTRSKTLGIVSLLPTISEKL